MKEKNRFDPYYIHLSELIYGKGFQSPGGEIFLDDLFNEFIENDKFDYRRALDIGFGCGGNSFYIRKRLNADVTGIDINDSFYTIALNTLKSEAITGVTFRKDSIIDYKSDELYDLVFCRDVFMYIENKSQALQSIINVLRPGGKIILIDYCRRQSEISAEFSEHIKKGGFYLFNLKEYSELFMHSELCNVVVRNITDLYREYIALSYDGFDHRAAEKLYKEEDIRHILQRTANKISWCLEGSMVWGLIVAEKRNLSL